MSDMQQFEKYTFVPQLRLLQSSPLVFPIKAMKDRPPLTFSLVVQLFLLAACGITGNQGFYLLGLYYLSPTYASAIQNTIPAIIFLLAAALSLEQVNINKRYGLAKVIGTAVSIGGATVITLYKGMPLLHAQPTHKLGAIVSSNPTLHWTLGFLFLLGNCLSWSAWMVFQGVVVTGLSTWLQMWCIDKGGPVFNAVFQPVQTVMVAIAAAAFLGDQLYTGGIIGAVLIVIGLYLVLWGKSEETKGKEEESKQDLSRRLLGEEPSREGKSATNDVP